MARPIVLGVVGDSGSGKTTLTRGLIRVLGAEHATRLNADPSRFLVVEGRLGFHTETLRSTHDVRVYLDPPEELRRAWKVKRDCTRRGYTTDEVLAELDRREQDARLFIRPQREHADILVSFARGADPAHLDVDVVLRDTLPHPDLSPLIDPVAGPTLVRRTNDLVMRVPGDIDPAHAAELEEAVRSRMSFANHLRVRRLGEFTVGTDLYRSDSLALVQLLILYHLMMGRIEQATGGPGQRIESRRSSGDDSALFL